MEYIRNTTKDKWTIMMYIKAREIRTSSAKEGANACNITFRGGTQKKRAGGSSAGPLATLLYINRDI